MSTESDHSNSSESVLPSFDFVEELEIDLRKTDPVLEYITRPRYGVDALGQGESVLIPVGSGKNVSYTKEDWGWTTDRDMHSYNLMLFTDQFDGSEPGKKLITVEKPDRSAVVAGGIEAAFAAGRVVIDLGSGEAVALLQYSRAYPRTTFIGIDTGYNNSETIDLQLPGVCLISDDWSTLSHIPDASVDTILSAQGGFMWGVSDSDLRLESTIFDSVTRVSKPGSILRFDSGGLGSEELDRVIATLGAKGWSVQRVDDVVIGVKNAEAESSSGVIINEKR